MEQKLLVQSTQLDREVWREEGRKHSRGIYPKSRAVEASTLLRWCDWRRTKMCCAYLSTVKALANDEMLTVARFFFRWVVRGSFSVALSGWAARRFFLLNSLPVADNIHNSRAWCSDVVSFTNYGLHHAADVAATRILLLPPTTRKRPDRDGAGPVEASNRATVFAYQSGVKNVILGFYCQPNLSSCKFRHVYQARPLDPVVQRIDDLLGRAQQSNAWKEHTEPEARKP